MRKALPAAPPAAPGSLAAALAAIPDPRRPYGWRPEYPPLPLVALLQLAVAAILCGARSLAAIAQWGRERVEDDPELLTALGLPPGRSPCVATVHRVFKALDVDAFEQAVQGWLARSEVEPTDALALDGKTLRGTQGGGQVPGVHLVAAYAHQAAVVLAQLRSEGKGHEVAAARQVLATVPLEGRLVTGDALLTQREVCTDVVGGGGDYLLPVKDNQPTLRADLEAAFSLWQATGPTGLGTPVAPAWLEQDLAARGGCFSAVAEVAPKPAHGRREARLLWALADPELNAYVGSAGTVGQPWPHLQQICRVERRRTLLRGGRVLKHEAEVSYAVTSRPPEHADATQLLQGLRGHWGIENKVHWVRDVTLDEDRSQVRSGAAPEAFATCRNLALTLLRRRGCENVAAALRTNASRPYLAVALVRSAGLT